MTPALNRRWFRFSLRTLFMVVTVFGCWLGWQVSIVRERKSLLRSLESRASDSYDPYTLIFTYPRSVDGSRLRSKIKWLPKEGSIPWFRRLLGDEPVGSLGLPSDMPEQERRHIRQAFPEAIISDDNQGPSDQPATTHPHSPATQI
jgi:hypothetical protein